MEEVFEAPSSTSTRNKHLLAVAAILFITIAAFAATFRYEFIYDDHKQIEQTQRYYTGVSWIPEYFTHPLTYNYYRPMFMVWFLMNNLLFGLNPVGWHVTTVLAHALATVLCYACAWCLTRRIDVSFITAAIFGIHPAHVESTAWISGVTDPLLAVFLLGAFWAYLAGRKRHRAALWICSAVLGAAAMFTKEVGVVLPALIAAHAALFENGDLRRRLKAAVTAALPTVAVAGAYWAARHHAMAGQQVPLGSWVQMFLVWPQALLFYVRHLIWPVDLAIFYEIYFDQKITAGKILWPTLGLLLAAGFIFAIWTKRRRPHEPFAVLWILLTLAPALYLRAFNGGDVVHDRYLYLPVFGFALILAYLIVALPSFGCTLLHVRAATVVACLVLFSFYVVRTNVEHAYYANDLKFYYRAVRVSPNNDLGWMNLAVDLADRKRYPEAFDAYRRSLALRPDGENAWLVHENLGYMLIQTGHLDEAERELNISKRLYSRFSRAYLHMGMVRIGQRRYREAIEELETAAKIDVFNAETHYLLAYAYMQLGLPEKELAELQKCLAIDPHYVNARNRLDVIMKPASQPK